MRGYFGIGSERISKAMNLGALIRTAHAFDASFAFTINAHHDAKMVKRANTAKSDPHLPVYEWERVEDMCLPKGCVMVGVELCEEAIELPSFRHPISAAYLLGPEQGNLSDEAMALCTHIVKIPTRFCINLSLAAALIMYDRVLTLGQYPPRPIASTMQKLLPEGGQWPSTPHQKQSLPEWRGGPSTTRTKSPKN